MTHGLYGLTRFRGGGFHRFVCFVDPAHLGVHVGMGLDHMLGLSLRKHRGHPGTRRFYVVLFRRGRHRLVNRHDFDPELAAAVDRLAETTTASVAALASSIASESEAGGES